ncbi:MAPK kinase substrate protein At1g80180-like [Cornus florida]|uniref:MAPK kinase substrate protein At1g80180-like n=1 Tax=Cornus florida TaxID=4283 RepID=UPI0028975D57|nr:MAPK kinase substrate protein At1g80180-like [Cornus florida]
MAGLQRSEISFRRSGSSGLVWDDKLISGELKQEKGKEEGGGGGGGKVESREQQSYRTVKVEPKLIDPPSPKVSGCCGGMFGKPVAQQKKPAKSARGGGWRKNEDSASIGKVPPPSFTHFANMTIKH